MSPLVVASATKLQLSSTHSLFEKGQRSGHGRFDFIEDKIEGNGKTMGYYEGAWKAGKYHGEGRVVWGSTGCSYEGEWLNGMMHGYGVKRDDRSGKILQEGFWARGKFHEAAAVDDVVIEDRCNELGDATARQDATRGVVELKEDNEPLYHLLSTVDITMTKSSSELDVQKHAVRCESEDRDLASRVHHY